MPDIITTGAAKSPVGLKLYGQDSAGNPGYFSGIGSFRRTTPLKIATFGDSIANAGSCQPSSNQDVSKVTATTWVSGTIVYSLPREKYALDSFYPMAHLVFSGGVTGEGTTQMLARDTAVASITRRAIKDLIDSGPDVCILSAGSINDLLSVTAGNSASTIATVLANHIEIVNRLTTCGVVIVDLGILGYSGVGATDLAATRAAIVSLNASYAALESQYPNYHFANLTDVLRDDTGAFITGISPDGTHPGYYAQHLLAEQIGNILDHVFGPSIGYRYRGANYVSNALITNVSSGLGVGFSVETSAATRSGTAIEIIDGKRFNTMTITNTAANGYCSITMPFDPSAAASGLTAALGIVSGDIVGFEFDAILQPASQFTFNSQARVDIRANTGAGRVVIDRLSGAAVVPATQIIEHIIFPPIVFGVEQANLDQLNSRFSLAVFAAEANAVYKLGIGNPRVVKLNQALVNL